MDTDYRYIGTIVSTHGLDGACVLGDMEFLPQIPGGCAVRVGFSASYSRSYMMEWMKEYKRGALLKLQGVDSIDDALTLKEQGLFVHARELRGDDAAMFRSELLNMTVVDATSSIVLGHVSDVWNTPAHRTLVVRTPDNDEVLMPLVPEFLRGTDRAKKQLFVQPPEGLFPINAQRDE